MERLKKLELIKRSLGLRHKLKVHESLEPPKTHEDLAFMLFSKWELEDELSAIEEMIADDRRRNVQEKRTRYEKEGIPFKPPKHAPPEDEEPEPAPVPEPKKRSKK